MCGSPTTVPPIWYKYRESNTFNFIQVAAALATWTLKENKSYKARTIVCTSSKSLLMPIDGIVAASAMNNRTLSKLERQSAEIRCHFSLLVESVPCETNAASAGTAPVGSGSVDANCQLSRIVRRPHERLPIPQAVVSAIFPIVSDNLQASALLISYRVDRTPVVNPKAFKALQRRAP